MNIFLHADDLGLSKGITDNILECIDYGTISSTSIIANGYAFEYAADEYLKRPNVRLTCHLNFAEGRPVTPPDKINLLVDNDGFFRNSFQSLWVKYLLSSEEKRSSLRHQIQLEISAQIDKMTDRIGNKPSLNIDSHQHFHMIPFIFESLVGLHNKYNFSYIRIPEEPFFFYFGGRQPFRNYFSSNLIKHCLLNTPARKYKKILHRMGINYSDYFIGVLFTGRMSESVVDYALSIIPEKNKHTTVEILFHPGRASEGEEIFWDDNEAAMKYYFSPWRDRERKTLTSVNFNKILLR